MGTYNGFNGIISVTVLLCGILFSILMGVLIRKKRENTNDAFNAEVPAPYWIIGFAYIVPGLVGIVASGFQKKAGYVIQIVFCLMALVATAVCFFGAITTVALWTLYAPKTCLEMQAMMQVMATCDDINSINGLSVGAGVVLILGWVFTFISTIIAGHHAFSRQDQVDKVENYITNHDGRMQQMRMPQAYVIQPTRYATGYTAHSGYSGVSVYQGRPVVYESRSGYNLPRYASKPSRYTSHSAF